MTITVPGRDLLARKFREWRTCTNRKTYFPHALLSQLLSLSCVITGLRQVLRIGGHWPLGEKSVCRFGVEALECSSASLNERPVLVCFEEEI